MKIERLNFDVQERPYCRVPRVGNWVSTAVASIGDGSDDIVVQTVRALDYLADIIR